MMQIHDDMVPMHGLRTVAPAPAVRARSNNSVLQPLERPALRWLAAHMPRRLSPDHLTLIGLIGSFAVFLGYVLCRYHSGFIWLANVGIVANWLGDSLDGTLARFRHIERPRYGFFIDHTTDVITEVLFALGLGLSPFVRFEIACLALISYLLIAVFTFVRSNLSGTLQIAFAGVGPTEVRLGMIILNVSFLVAPPVPVLTLWAPLSVYDLAVLGAAGTGFLFFIFSVRQEARRLALEDPAGSNGA
jgi:archaetidylinositol phosphate synthase